MRRRYSTPYSISNNFGMVVLQPCRSKQAPPLNPIEMASKSWDEIISKLDKDPVLKKISRRFIRKDLPGKILLMRSPNLKKR